MSRSDDSRGGTVIDLTTELGTARMHLAEADHPVALLMLGHGAGGGVESADLTALAESLPAKGISVARFEQPWRTAGKKVAPAPPRLDLGWKAAMDWAGDHLIEHPGASLFLGGRSAGARVSCRAAAGQDAADGHRVRGVVCLAFPLHPPGKPESSRLHELLGAPCPTLVLQGSKDTFGTAEDLAGQVAGHDRIDVVTVPDCGHDFRPPKRADTTAEDVAALVTTRTATFLTGLVG